MPAGLRLQRAPVQCRAAKVVEETKTRRVMYEPGPPDASGDVDTRSEALRAIEDLVIDSFGSARPGMRLDWNQVEGCWVLRPPAAAGPPKAVAHFLGSAFVGAAPELAYKLFLESLAARGVLVRASPSLKPPSPSPFPASRCSPYQI